jgi:hypothetical protein
MRVRKDELHWNPAMRYSVLFLASLVLAACATAPRIVNSTPDGVSFAFEGDDVHRASAAADDYCDELHRFATLHRVDRAGDENVAVFSCDPAKSTR